MPLGNMTPLGNKTARALEAVRRWLRDSLDQLTPGQQWTTIAVLGLIVVLLGAGAPDRGAASAADLTDPGAIAARPIEGIAPATPVPQTVPAPTFGAPVEMGTIPPMATTTTTSTTSPTPPTTSTTEPPPTTSTTQPSPLPVPLPLP